jgi:hypothetical protein
MDTVFGRVPKGRTDGTTHSTSVTTHLVQCSLNNLLQRFWELEEVPTQKLLTSEEKERDWFFEAIHYRDESGRHVVQLPFKEATPELESLRKEGVQHLKQMQTCINKSPERRDSKMWHSRENVKTWDTQNWFHSKLQKPHDQSCYLPQNAVMKESYSTTKIRAVF